MTRSDTSESTETEELPRAEPRERKQPTNDGWGDLNVPHDDAIGDGRLEAPSFSIRQAEAPAKNDGWGDAPSEEMPSSFEVATAEQQTLLTEQGRGEVKFSHNDHISDARMNSRTFDNSPAASRDDDGWGEVPSTRLPASLEVDTLGANLDAETSDGSGDREVRARRANDETAVTDRHEVTAARARVDAAYEAHETFSDGPLSAEDIQAQRVEASDLADQPIADLHHIAGANNVNGAYRVELADGRHGFLKAELEEGINIVGEDTLRADVPKGSQWRREVAAYSLDNAASLGLVPETVIRHEPQLDFDNGSLQAEVPAGPKRLDQYENADVDRMAALDYVLGNTDRHNENYMTQENGRPAAIDNGLTMPEGDADGIRSQWVAERLGKTLDPTVAEQFRSVNEASLLRNWAVLGISDKATSAAIERLHEIQGGVLTGEAWRGEIFDGSIRSFNLVRGRI